MENSPPEFDFSSTYLMEVNQFCTTALTSNMIRASDSESHDSDLIFNITTKMDENVNGVIVSTDDRDQPIFSFRQNDLWELKIAYKPPAHASDQERTYSFDVQAVDTEGSTSNTISFIVVVYPMYTFAPVVYKNTGLILHQVNNSENYLVLKKSF